MNKLCEEFMHITELFTCNLFNPKVSFCKITLLIYHNLIEYNVNISDIKFNIFKNSKTYWYILKEDSSAKPITCTENKTKHPILPPYQKWKDPYTKKESDIKFIETYNKEIYPKLLYFNYKLHKKFMIKLKKGNIESFRTEFSRVQRSIILIYLCIFKINGYYPDEMIWEIISNLKYYELYYIYKRHDIKAISYSLDDLLGRDLQ